MTRKQQQSGKQHTVVVRYCDIHKATRLQALYKRGPRQGGQQFIKTAYACRECGRVELNIDILRNAI